jgi:hypothetical protein
VDASSTPDTGGGGTDGTGGGGTGGNGDGGTSTSPSTKPSTKTSTPAGPRIEVFAAVGIASCPSGGPNFSSPGGVTLTWKVTGATMVGLSIDDNTPFKQSGHGSWRDYPVVYTTASDDVPFACSDPTGTKTHKYFLDAIANGVHVTKTLTLSAYWAGSA